MEGEALAFWHRMVLRDGEISGAFKAAAGNMDRDAGIVWRWPPNQKRSSVYATDSGN